MDCSYSTIARSDRSSVAAQSPLAPQALGDPAPSGTFDILDLGLMHHYATVTSNNVFPNGLARFVWQETIPLEAQRHPLLMHGILAIAAMHLACLQEDENAEYRIRAFHHQNIGVLGFRSALTAMSKENAHIMFAFSMMLSILAFASPQLSEMPPDVDNILEMFSLLQGNKLVWELEQDTIHTSAMVKLLPTHHQPAGESKLDAGHDKALHDLESLSDDAACMSAIQQLRVCLEIALAAPDEVPMAARWAVTMEERFLFLLKAHKPEALVILAHYGLIVRSYRQTWWLSSWCNILVDAVDKTLSDESKEAVGWQSKLEFLTH